MSVSTTPNRAPDFKKLYADEAEFVVQRDGLPTPTGRAKPPAPFSAERLRTERAIPRGFSIGALGREIARSVSARIVSEHDGEVDYMLVSVPREPRKPIDELDARHYAALFAGLGRSVRYIIVCDPRQQQAMARIGIEAGLPADSLLFALSPRFNYSIWAQDAYVALNDASGGMILCEGISFPRYEDMTVADDVAAQCDVAVLQSYLYFQGGNVLNSGPVTLIGMDYVERNARRFRMPDVESVKTEFAALFGTDIVPLGGRASGQYAWYQDGRLSGYGFQPIFHIDMYVTPTGVAGQSGKEIVFLGRPEAAKTAVGRYSDVAAVNNGTYNSFFDETEAQLAARFEVQYLPLWLTRSNLGLTGVEPRYYNLTFNNCIVQAGASSRRVLLPSYSQDAADYGVDGEVRQQLESAAESAWTRLGFQVAWMDGVEDLAFNQGAVHCITKTLRRRA
jgi:hypothetical protein